MAIVPKGPTDNRDAYLGLLYPSEDFRVYVYFMEESHTPFIAFIEPLRYGFVTNTKVKFMIVVDDTVFREAEIKTV